MIELIVKVLINAVAMLVAVKVLEPSKLLSFNFGNDWWKLLLVALVFALINTYIKPIVKALSMPIGILTLGLVAFLINAVMLLAVAFVSGQLKLGFKVGDYPPNLLTSDTIVGAVLASLIISVVSTIASVALSPRKLI